MERIEYDEFGLFHENAEEFGIPYAGPPVVRREFVEVEPGRRLSALVWGTSDPALVFLHGGSQNAHTWDTVALALARPLAAIDLPGHGHSDRGRRGSLSLTDNAEDVAQVIRSLAPDAGGVIGMSLGGLTTLALSSVAPDLVRSIVLVDVLPSVKPDSAQVIADFINGPESFASFDDILARTIQYNPTRSVSSLRRGILHNAEQREDGSWVWRYARHRAAEPGDAEDAPPIAERFEPLWDAVSAVKVPLMFVRGMRAQSVVDDAHEAELLRRLPSARVEHVQEAGHSVQGDAPLELAHLIDDFMPS
jgi:pimeloyl-ACP methyl ester carboxylesterase